MIFTVVKDPIPYLIIDNTYTKDEQVKIYKELDFLSEKLLTPEQTGSAKKDNGELKKNTGLFLDNVYVQRQVSDILTVNRKIFSKDVASELFKCHYAYNMFNMVNMDNTLVSYYDDNDSYFSHSDNSPITAVTWFFKSPKNFTGGDFIFTDFNERVELKNNRTVIFFGCYKHEVTEIKIKDKSVPFSGRFTLSQFCNIGNRA
jgi:Rps23 Pro-64 3,4-dihydroxylase Tpa1-like proline 4-hydroxylase